MSADWWAAAAALPHSRCAGLLQRGLQRDARQPNLNDSIQHAVQALVGDRLVCENLQVKLLALRGLGFLLKQNLLQTLNAAERRTAYILSPLLSDSIVSDAQSLLHLQGRAARL